MISKLQYSALYLILILTFAACDSRENKGRTLDHSALKDPLIKANQEAVRIEKEQIDDFIARRGWNMETTETGIRYMLIRRGAGAFAEKGRKAELDYTLTLLTGDTVYTSAEKGPINFRIGYGEVITGLEEAILMLRVGDRAKIIIPSHLAFGLIGDQDKIRHKASLVYDLEFTRMY